MTESTTTRIETRVCHVFRKSRGGSLMTESTTTRIETFHNGKKELIGKLSND